VQKFSKNLGTTSKFQLPEGQHAARSILRKLVATTQICRLRFMHPCYILTVQKSLIPNRLLESLTLTAWVEIVFSWVG